MTESILNLFMAVALLACGGAVIWDLLFDRDDQSTEPDTGKTLNERCQQALDSLYECYPHLRYTSAGDNMSSEDEASEDDDVMMAESQEEDYGFVHGISENHDYYYDPSYSWMPGNIFNSSDTDSSGCSDFSRSDDLINNPAYSSLSCNIYRHDHSW